jgi:hypothetical protein
MARKEAPLLLELSETCDQGADFRDKSWGTQLRKLFAKVDSFYRVRENFRLTPSVWPRSLGS